MVKKSTKKSVSKADANKRQLTHQQEFEILKLVLDKFLWLGLVVLGIGFYKMVTTSDIMQGLTFLFVGIIILGIFMYTLIKEYEFIY